MSRIHGNFHGDFLFREVLGFRPLLLDLRLPEGDGPHPVVMRLHGGGWRTGSRRHLSETVRPFGLHKRMPARGLAAALTGAGTHGELLVVPGAGHEFTGAEDIGALVEASAEFTHREVGR